MTVRVRFAPSPTGLLHIGGARTALYCQLFAKANGGSYILRIEDTDQERSKREYEVAMIDDLKWCGIHHQEGPDLGGDVGPYRQSERTQIYKDIAWSFVEKGFAYPCFLTNEELEKLTEKAQSEKAAPHKYHGQYRNLPSQEAKNRIEQGESFVIRFKNPQREWTFSDLVRGSVTFPKEMVGDFVIQRSSGMPVYNFCCVIDDWKMKMTHIIRAEEHLNNTVRQLMIYNALEVQPPLFAHCSLLVGADRQKLSKRHGATSVRQYRDQDYLPKALMNYLCLLGWSHPDEKDIFDLNTLGDVFKIDRFNKAPAFYDIQKLNFFNEQYLRALPPEEVAQGFERSIPKDSPFHQQTQKWKLDFVALYQEKVQIFSDINKHLDLIFGVQKEDSEETREVLSWESTAIIKSYITLELKKLQDSKETGISSELFSSWMKHLKKELKIKGKPLFMGVRVVLTLRPHGPDLMQAIPLTPLNIIIKRLEA